MDETWLYHYDPETKQHSMKWGHSASPRPKKFRVQKVFVSIFWDRYGILLIDYIPKAQNINAEYYSSLLVQLKEIFKENVAIVYQGILVLAPQCPGASGTCNPEKLASVLIIHPTQRIWPVGLPLILWTEKNN